MATMARDSRPSLRLTRTFDAPPEKVFAALTQPAQLMRWFAPGDDYTTPRAEVDLRPGGRYLIEMRWQDQRYVVSGAYREVRAPQRLVFTWKWEDWPAESETLVTIELRSVAGGTELALTHEFFPDVEQRDKHQGGWNACLDRLAASGLLSA